MRAIKTLLVVVIFSLLSFSLNPAWGQYTIWHSPLTFTTDDSRLTINFGSPSTTIRITTSSAGDLQWVDLGLVIPSNVKIDSVNLYYELSNSSSFISQVRLTKTTTPDKALVQHDDPTDITNVGPGCYSSFVNGLVAQGTITLGLRLNFASTSDWIDIGGIGIVVSPLPSSVQKQANTNVPENFSLKQNYPNPFNPQTIIEYEIQSPGKVELYIYNSLGERIRTLVNEPKSQGLYSILWDGKDNRGQNLAAGVYFYQLKVGDFTGAKRMALIK